MHCGELGRIRLDRQWPLGLNVVVFADADADTLIREASGEECGL